MPFTPFHIGPAIFFGTVLSMNIPTVIVSRIILDIEPLLVVILGLNHPLHGFFHTFLGSSFIAISLSIFMKRILKNERTNKILSSSFLGVYSHIIFDSPLYSDIKPFYPLNFNPLYGIISVGNVYNLCIFLFIIGSILYIFKLKT